MFFIIILAILILNGILIIFLRYKEAKNKNLLLMGSIAGVILSSLMMVFLFSDTSRIEKNVLIPKFKDEYHKYQKKVPKRMYSPELLFILILEYVLFLTGIIFTYILI